MASVIFTTTSSTISQLRRHNVEWNLISNWIVYLIVGAFSASFLIKIMPAQTIKLFLAVLILCVALIMLTGWIPTSKGKRASKPFAATVGTGAGLVSGMAAIGGGNIVVPTLVYFNTPILRAIAASSVSGMAISTFGSLGYVINGWTIDHPGTLGYIYLPALVPIAIANILFAPLGVRVAQHLKATILSKVFACFMLSVSMRLFYDVFFR